MTYAEEHRRGSPTARTGAKDKDDRTFVLQAYESRLSIVANGSNKRSRRIKNIREGRL